MKKMTGGVTAALAAVLLCAGCASMQYQADLEQAAKEHDFGYYFSSLEGRHDFDDLDAARRFLDEAAVKFRLTGAKQREIGLAGTAAGPVPGTGGGVTAGYFVSAWGKDGNGTIAKDAGPAEMEKGLKESTATSLMFIVFYEDRIIIISDIYLKEGYRFLGNPRPSYLEFEGNSYRGSYPAGWNTERAFRYLREGQ